jgi:hypothetical protein
MTVVTKLASIPVFFLAVAAVVISVNSHRPSSLDSYEALQSNFSQSSFLPAASMRHVTESRMANTAEINKANEAKDGEDNEDETTYSVDQFDFQLLTNVELRTLTHEELLGYMLDFRRFQLFETDFMSKEYQLFQAVLDIEPFAAIDYMVSIGHDASSEFFYNFLYSDFMIHDGKSDDVVEYINRFGPHVNLLNLIAFANLTDGIAPHVRYEVLSEYVLGNVDYHSIIKFSQWDTELTDDDKIKAFLNTVPTYIEDPYELISDIAKINNPSTYKHLKQFLMEHPDRYRLFHVIKEMPDIDLYSVATTLMNEHSLMDVNDKVQSALIAIHYGDKHALRYLVNVAQKPLILKRPINVEYAILKAVTAPEYVTKTLAWAESELESLSFNPFTEKFEF